MNVRENQSGNQEWTIQRNCLATLRTQETGRAVNGHLCIRHLDFTLYISYKTSFNFFFIVKSFLYGF
jgi:hypothetical protein